MDIIECNNLIVCFKKVKGHSKDVYNDRVDRLSKEGRKKLLLQVNPCVTKDQRLTIKWHDTILEGSIRAHFKMIHEVYFKENWINSFACRSIRAIKDQCNWPMTWQNLKYTTS